MASSDGLQRRRLLASDIPAAYALSVEAGWNQTQADWGLMLRRGEGFGVTDRGRLVATALTHGFGPIAWISMVLVTRDHRRRGLATELLGRCIRTLVEKGATPGLDATEAGRPVYERLGFRAIYPLDRRAATILSCEAPVPGNVRPVTRADLAALAGYDKGTFGADRREILHHLLERSPELAFIAQENAKVLGFVLGRDGREATQIGPLMADNPAVAIGLVDAALAKVSGRVYIDTLDRHRELNAHLAMRGFDIQRAWTRMLLERSFPFDDSSRTFAIAGPELA
jgi:GNAT superfamily N-acetyltransferase